MSVAEHDAIMLAIALWDPEQAETCRARHNAADRLIGCDRFGW
jgi:hypothetical protein